MAFYTRQPFGEIGSSRLQALSSAKNRQNSIPIASDFSASTLKQSTKSTGKRRAAEVFEDNDSENIDPSIFNSPAKKSKSSPCDGYIKPAKFSLISAPTPKEATSVTPSALVPSVRRALSSPKHKRVGLLSKRRASSSPYRRVDPPTATPPSGPAPFSIDAALKGSIPDYTPRPVVAAPKHTSIEESMPQSWFFEIHEDTPEQEAANLMEHSAAVLDISSDDDAETKKKNDELERGKENIPPPDFVAQQAAAADPTPAPSAPAEETDVKEQTASIEHTVKLPRLRNIAQDAMDEDRSPLKDLPPAEFYAEGLDASSYVTVDASIERPSSLSKEFDFSIPSPSKEAAEAATVEKTDK
ncbi:hypothetical protein BU24DRAFT_487835 [Aaosphaeria arxii CBS 175.79]|uniref:Thymidylate kinase n=1 Tax=Aaosphaeria arxii CBS 175.79 TaxID=1450172 RepID=A0A6A5Y7X8_9PLEO|nr:uncharacterized protein BU24DRAFT_487835 [Aaosphaeria arxii CBS 175.79]KAF2021406.1 hypothetical protein BU24DRAFT_487835 [Aaosphaeria arxii CBS 175.79]